MNGKPYHHSLGDTPLSYDWQFNGNPLTNGVGVTLTLSETCRRRRPGPTASGDQRLWVVLSSNALLTVLDPWIVVNR